ncbi:molybdopterin-dependent oxidoreductase [Desulfobacula sp.]|uniref:molybdopterin oxidoreductase family protein n=1 Tax=Desulfobacula sp. TaxID=2593537 RepID=UPI00261904B8|nr:molybdopterin-dependent oxidoreductase [Desulfobacula sp.]
MTNSIAEFERDSNVIFVIGSNTTACHPMIASRIIKAKEKGARLIVADPRNIQLAGMADLCVHHRLGSDVALLNGMMHVILKNNWHSEDYIHDRCEDFDAFKQVMDHYTPERVSKITQVEQKDIERMAELYATHSPAALLYAMGITQHTTGLTITDMISAIDEGRIKAMYVIGENPKLSDPDWNHLNHALKKLDFLLVQDIFLSETAQIADTVFSSAALGEREGTFTNTERRCMRTRKAVAPVGNTLSDWEIISKLATAMGYPMAYTSAQDIFDEITALTEKNYGGMTYDRLGINGLQWPCPDGDHPGTPYLHKDVFARGKGKFHAVEYRDPAELACEDYPFLLTTGRMFAHFHTGTMTRISKHLDVEQKTGYVEINPEDAQRKKIMPDETVLLTSRRGQMEVPARITTAVRPGTLFLPIHFGENPTNILTSSSAFDPLAKIPEFKVGAVKLEKLIQ